MHYARVDHFRRAIKIHATDIYYDIIEPFRKEILHLYLIRFFNGAKPTSRGSSQIFRSEI